MLILLIALGIWFQGEFTRYAPRVMERVVAYRLEIGQLTPCPACVGEIAVIEPRYLNWRAYITFPDGRVVGPFHVTDCAEQKHRENLRRRGWVGEFSYASAVKYDALNGLDDVRLFLMPPREYYGR